MGLDMRLRAVSPKTAPTEVVVGWDFCEFSQDWSIPVTATKGGDVEWRKANAIHGWFVRATGKPCYHEIEISTAQLYELVSECQRLLSLWGQPQFEVEAQTSMPTQAGAFFGSQEYGDGYRRTLEYTVEKVQDLLDREGDTLYTYEADW